MELCELDRLIEAIHDKDITVEAFNDSAGVAGVSVLAGERHFFVLNDDRDLFRRLLSELLTGSDRVFCWDMRKLLELGMPLRESRAVIDVKLCFGGETTLLRLAREHLPSDEYIDLLNSDQQFSSHVRACKTAQVDLGRHSFLRLVPPRFVQRLTSVRAKAIQALATKWLQGGGEGPYNMDTYPMAVTLYRIEQNRIKVDVDYVQEQLKVEHDPATARFFRSIDGLQKDGYIRTQFNAAGGRTGRIKVESGFNCMGIPHGPSRKALVSRFPNGEIVAFDFNAIDYRCIIQSTADVELEGMYMDADDFHLRTTEKLFGKRNANAFRRKIIKQFTYVYAYGGSEGTLSSKTGLSIGKVREIMSKMDFLYPVATLRDRLHEAAMVNGYVDLPDGRRIIIPKDAHPGMTLGLYAQSFSSSVFESALQAAAAEMEGMRSKIIFTVHDEMVVDMDHAEHTKDVDIVSAMEHARNGYVFKVNVKKGKSYGDATG